MNWIMTDAAKEKRVKQACLTAAVASLALAQSECSSRFCRNNGDNHARKN